MRRDIVQGLELSASIRGPGRRRKIAVGLRRALAVLLAAGMATACTVRLELASQRAVPGDLAVTSSGLAPHHGWSDDVLDERPSSVATGLALAAVLPPDDERGPVDLLPAEDPAPAAPEAVPAPVTSVTAPIPAIRPVEPHAWHVITPPPAKPILLAALARSGGRPSAILAKIAPAAGPGRALAAPGRGPAVHRLFLPAPAKPALSDAASGSDAAPGSAGPARRARHPASRVALEPAPAPARPARRPEVTWISPERLSLVAGGAALLLDGPAPTSRSHVPAPRRARLIHLFPIVSPT